MEKMWYAGSMQKLLTEPGTVLNCNGSPNAGYSTKEVLRYERKAIQAKPWRIKEWDFYQIEDVAGTCCLQLTYGHASYVGQIGVMLFDIARKRFLVKKSVLIPFAFGRMKLPESAETDSVISWHKGGVHVVFETKSGVRNLYMKLGNFETRLRLEPLIDDALIIAIPFDESPKQFYYNYKRNCMKCSGVVNFYDGGEKKIIKFGDEADALKSYALLDWGRGVWPFSNEWFWSNGSGTVGGKLFGFNLGCGFGNTSQATENIVFYENAAHKLGRVAITHEDDWMQPWHLKDDEGRCDLVMMPQFDRITRDKILFIDNCTHQVFGMFSGSVTLDDGRVLCVKDIPAFAEHAVNNW